MPQKQGGEPVIEMEPIPATKTSAKEIDDSLIAEKEEKLIADVSVIEKQVAAPQQYQIGLSQKQWLPTWETRSYPFPQDQTIL